ncbi:MAG: hypothetical protein IJ590_04055 [Rickettsiales bacterium]|nr:hypothetical protein [Rickettsiales bacterium]
MTIIGILFDILIFMMASGAVLFLFVVTQFFYTRAKPSEKFIRFSCRTLQVFGVICFAIFLILFFKEIVRLFN